MTYRLVATDGTPIDLTPECDWLFDADACLFIREFVLIERIPEPTEMIYEYS